jgi:hypothetical protein
MTRTISCAESKLRVMNQVFRLLATPGLMHGLLKYAQSPPWTVTTELLIVCGQAVQHRVDTEYSTANSAHSPNPYLYCRSYD